MAQKVIKGDDIKKDVGDVEKKAPRVEVGDLVGERGGVINKEVLNASGRANKIIEDSETEAHHIREEAKKILSQIKEEKENQKKIGFEEGRTEGLSTVVDYAVKLQRLKEDFAKQAEPEVIKLVMEIVEKVIGKLVYEHEETIKSVVRQALESSLGDRIVIHLNPEDYDLVTNDEKTFKEVMDRTKRLVFRKNENVARGGCIVETEVGTIDAQLDVQLKAIKKALEL